MILGFKTLHDRYRDRKLAEVIYKIEKLLKNHENESLIGRRLQLAIDQLRFNDPEYAKFIMSGLIKHFPNKEFINTIDFS